MVWHLAVTSLILVTGLTSDASPEALMSTFFFGFLIDGDHVISYWVHERVLTLDVRRIHRWFVRYGNRLMKDRERIKAFPNDLLIPFHQVEVWALISVVLWLEAQPLALVAYLLHSLMDILPRLSWRYLPPLPSLLLYLLERKSGQTVKNCNGDPRASQRRLEP